MANASQALVDSEMAHFRVLPSVHRLRLLLSAIWENVRTFQSPAMEMIREAVVGFRSLAVESAEDVPEVFGHLVGGCLIMFLPYSCGPVVWHWRGFLLLLCLWFA